MIQVIGVIEIIIFYSAYLIKLFRQKSKGITTNQLGKGKKSNRTVLVEISLKIMSFLIIIAMVLSAVLDTSFYSSIILRGLGLIVSGGGCGVFIAAMITMKDSWRAGIPEEANTAMVTDGIYRFSRNPAFLGFDLTYIGSCLAFGNIILFVMSLLTILIMHLQILEEEKFLEKTFGQGYLDYKRKVRRYL